MTQTTGKTIPGIKEHKTFIELIQAFPPRYINSEEELDATQRVIDYLIDKNQGNLTEDEQQYLHLLGLVVREYEQAHYPLPTIHGVELIKVFMDELKLQTKNLVSIFETEANVLDVLDGKRDLTVTNIENLAKLFQISPTAFLKGK